MYMRRTAAAGSGGDSSSLSSPSSSAESSFREHDDVFLQTQARKWLGEVLQRRIDDQLNLSELLADGELLFEVSKIVWTMLLAKCKELRHVKGQKYNPFGSRKSSGRYRPYSNVDSFLKICKILGLHSVDLFSPSDVVEKRDTRKVCICIRSLSKKARSKQLKVPNFDIVTYSVAMPTNVVDCLRRSLELSNCSSTTLTDYTPDGDGKSKSCQKSTVSDCERKNGICSEAFDNTEGKHLEVPNYSFSESNYYDTSDDSPEVTSALCVSPRNIQNHRKNDHELRYHKLSCPEENKKSFCSEYDQCSPMLNNILSGSADSERASCTENRHDDNILKNHETDFLDDASSVEDSLDDMAERLYISPQLAFPEIDIGIGSISFDGEDSMYKILLGSDTQGSTSTARSSQNGFGSRSSEDFDVEVSSVSSMSSVLGRMLNLDFDDQFDGGDLRHEIQDLDDYENSAHIADAEKRAFITDDGISGLCTTFSLSYPDSQSHPMEYKEHLSPSSEFDVSQLHSIKALYLKNQEHNLNCLAKNEADPAIITCASDCPTMSCDSSITGEKHEELDALRDGTESSEQGHSASDKFDNCLASEIRNKRENTENLGESLDAEEDASTTKRPSVSKAHKRPLLRTVVKGTAVFGMVFFLLHLRNRSGSKHGNEGDKKSNKIRQANGLTSTVKLQKRGKGNGVYPTDKFKFQN